MARSAHSRASAGFGTASERVPLSSWYTQGSSDGFGDRLLMFDNAATGPLELLRVRTDFSYLAEFEVRVRQRFNRLSAFNHPGFAHARAIDHLETDDGLTVVSTHVPGTRLSELFPASRPRAGMHPAIAHWVLSELASSLAALHEYPGVAHAALAPERVVITADRHVVISDYLFGDALDAMRLPPERLWNEFGVIHEPGFEGRRLDQRSDVLQLALVALSLVAGRRVAPDEYIRRRPQLVAEFTTACEQQMTTFGRGLCTWLERALAPDGFRSAIEANRALIELTGAPAIDGPTDREHDTRDADRVLSMPNAVEERRTAIAARPASETPETEDLASRRSRFGPVQWMAAALAIIGVVQGAVIARLVFRSSPASVAAIAQPAPEPAAAAGPGVVDRRDSVLPSDAASEPPASAPEPTTSAAPPPTPTVSTPGAVIASSRGAGETAALDGASRNGTLRLESPLALEVSSGGRRLDSSRGSIALSPGTHELTFSNASLGVRITQTVRIEPGRQTVLNIDAPRGSLNANAQPWAQVSIDGRAIGETPLANVAVVVGEHEIVFRHPQLGERRQRVTVRADALTRVSATFAR